MYADGSSCTVQWYNKNGKAEIEIANIGTYIAILRADHVWRPECGAKSKDLIDVDGKSLTIGTQADRVHLCRRYPATGRYACGKVKAQIHKNIIRTFWLTGIQGRQPGTHGGEDKHTAPHDSVANQHSEASAAVLDDRSTDTVSSLGWW